MAKIRTMKPSYKALIIATILYLPFVVIFLYLIKNHKIEVVEKEKTYSLQNWQLTHDEPKIMPNIVTKEELITDLTKPKKEQVAPPKVATKKPSNQSGASDQNSSNLSLDQLNSIFAPTPKRDQNISDQQSVDLSVPKSELGDLYGLMVFDLSEEEKKYLDKHLDPIGRITQRYLRYPHLAGEMRMSGETILHFVLMPNGDISPIEIYKSSGFRLLDENAVYTVQIAYKDYPHPKEPTRIRMRVLYRLY